MKDNKFVYLYSRELKRRVPHRKTEGDYYINLITKEKIKYKKDKEISPKEKKRYFRKYFARKTKVKFWHQLPKELKTVGSLTKRKK